MTAALVGVYLENVVGAGPYMENPTMICGAGLGLGASGMDLHRHRLFETSFPLMGVACSRHHSLSMGVYGNGTNSWHREKLGRNQAPPVRRVPPANTSRTEALCPRAGYREPNRYGRVSGKTAQDSAGRCGVPQIDLGGGR